MAEVTLKRKLERTASGPSRKRTKLTRTSRPQLKKTLSKSKKSVVTTSVSVNDLPWKTVRTQGYGDEGEGGILELEEVEDVEVVYGQGEAGRIVGFKVKEPVPEVVTAKITEDTPDEVDLSVAITIDPFEGDLLPSWSNYPLHPALLHSLHKRGFENPTEIQRRALDTFFEPRKAKEENVPEAESPDDSLTESRQRDIIGIAQTGSGKTLAYGLPILHHILSTLSATSTSSSGTIVTPPPSTHRRPLQALILAPTRELALQVSEHLNKCLDKLFEAQSEVLVKDKKQNEEKRPAQARPPPPISVAAIVGGMSAQKQRRILSRGVDVLVATPGRFWDLCEEDPSLTSQLHLLRFLVLDEADRMVEAGHFQELDNILRLTVRFETDIANADDPSVPTDIPEMEIDAPTRNESLQTFVFSATMSKDLQRDLKRRSKKNYHGKGKKEGPSTLDDLIMKLDFRDPDPVIIDLSPEGGRVEGLQESMVECLANDKDVYLYYFLLRHPGRSLVFLASIDGIRRLLPLMELLKIDAWPLHSGLQQKQRLKNFDRFKSTPNSVLLATDVAARGLDVPAVDHVIHYQVPRSADAYVHRNGRTARAMQKGFGLVLCAPDEKRVFKGILTSLGRDQDDVAELNVDHDILDKLKARVQIARKIDNKAHRVKKEKHDRNWMRETAEAMEIQLGSEFESDESDSAVNSSIKRRREVQVMALKAELKQALSQPLVARGVSTRYITSGSRAVADDLIGGENHETILGLKKVNAGSEIVRKKSGKEKAKP